MGSYFFPLPISFAEGIAALRGNWIRDLKREAILFFFSDRQFYFIFKNLAKEFAVRGLTKNLDI